MVLNGARLRKQFILILMLFIAHFLKIHSTLLVVLYTGQASAPEATYPHDIALYKVVI